MEPGIIVRRPVARAAGINVWLEDFPGRLRPRRQGGSGHAALDERVKPLAAVCSLNPLQHTAPGDGKGLRHYSHLHGLLPRLGFFAGEEAQLPFDYDRILALVAQALR